MAGQHGNTRAALARYKPKMSTAERDARFAKLQAQRYTVTEIARMEGVDKSAVSRGIKRAMAAVRAEGGRELQQAKFLELEAAAEMAWEIAHSPQWKTSPSGAVIRSPETGEPLIDQALVLSALDTVRKCVGDQRALMGLDEPKRTITASLNLNDLEHQVRQNAVRLQAAVSPEIEAAEVIEAELAEEEEDSGE